jgi:hypothetical protein
MLLLSQRMPAASKSHAVFFGKSMAVKLLPGSDESRAVPVKVRPLYVDGRMKEFTIGEAHDVTDRQFVVQRIFRMNDSLPGDDPPVPRWRWQRGGWLLVDRTSGRVSPLRLPDFDAVYSEAAWYRDYAAYCGIPENADKLYAVVAQLGSRKPVLHSPLQSIGGAGPEAACGRPVWQRAPARVTFELPDSRKSTFEIHGHAADLAPPEEDEN